MTDQVVKLFSRLERLEKIGENSLEGKGLGHGNNVGDPPPSSPMNEIYSSSSHHHHMSSGNASKKPLFKLDVKVDIPMNHGRRNAENLKK